MQVLQQTEAVRALILVVKAVSDQQPAFRLFSRMELEKLLPLSQAQPDLPAAGLMSTVRI